MALGQLRNCWIGGEVCVGGVAASEVTSDEAGYVSCGMVVGEEVETPSLGPRNSILWLCLLIRGSQHDLKKWTVTLFQNYRFLAKTVFDFKRCSKLLFVQLLWSKSKVLWKSKLYLFFYLENTKADVLLKTQHGSKLNFPRSLSFML